MKNVIRALLLSVAMMSFVACGKSGSNSSNTVTAGGYYMNGAYCYNSANQQMPNTSYCNNSYGNYTMYGNICRNSAGQQVDQSFCFSNNNYYGSYNYNYNNGFNYGATTNPYGIYPGYYPAYYNYGYGYFGSRGGYCYNILGYVKCKSF